MNSLTINRKRPRNRVGYGELVLLDDDRTPTRAGDTVCFKWEYRVIEWHGTHARTKKLQRASDAELRLLCGELSAQEVRTIRAVLNFILPNDLDQTRGKDAPHST